MRRTALEVAIAAGLCVAFPLYMLLTMPESDGSPNPLTLRGAGALLLILASYAAAALTHTKLRERSRVFGPVWLWVPVLGSAVVAVAGYRFDFLYGGGAELWAKGWLFLSIWTLLPAVVVYYSGAALRWFRKWHAETPADTSIRRGW